MRGLAARGRAAYGVAPVTMARRSPARAVPLDGAATLVGDVLLHVAGEPVLAARSEGLRAPPLEGAEGLRSDLLHRMTPNVYWSTH